jgi:hypothetical protein
MDEDFNLRTSQTGSPGKDALRTLLEETRTALARAQRRNERSEELLAGFSRQTTALWVAVAILAVGFILLAILDVVILRKG